MLSSTPYRGRKKGGCRKARLGVGVHCTGEERREGAGKRGLECESNTPTHCFLAVPPTPYGIVCLITVVCSA